MAYAKTVATISTQKSELPLIREKYSIPDPLPNDPEIEYITAIKEDCKVERAVVGGLDFQKFVLPSEASYTSNVGKQFFPQQIVRRMTKMQADSLWERAKAVFVTFDGKTVPVSEIIVLEPKQKFASGNATLKSDITSEKIESVDPLSISARDRQYTEIEYPKKDNKGKKS